MSINTEKISQAAWKHLLARDRKAIYTAAMKRSNEIKQGADTKKDTQDRVDELKRGIDSTSINVNK